MKLKCAAVIAVMLSGVAMAGEYDAAVSIKNRSSWDIHELYLSSVDDNDWGPDQLGEEVIAGGESFKLHGIPCDAYDVRLVDEDGDVCVVNAVALCVDQDAWVINDDDLLACQEETTED